jgi:hypothetical protein
MIDGYSILDRVDAAIECTKAAFVRADAAFVQAKAAFA